MLTQQVVREQPINIEKIFEHFPNDCYWKMLIDQGKWADGKDCFDNERSYGYLKAAGRGLYCMLTTINEPLSWQYILALHYLSYPDKTGLKSRASTLKQKIGYHDHLRPLTESGLSLSAMQAGTTLQAFLPSGIAVDSTEAFSYFKSSLQEIGWGTSVPYCLANEIGVPFFIYMGDFEQATQDIFKHLSENNACALTRQEQDIYEITKKMAECLDQYHADLTEAETDAKKIMIAIVRFIRECHRFHFFFDGNGRTFIFLLLNKLLIQNGLPPTIVPDPAKFTALSFNALVREVELGQQTFRAQYVPTKNEPFLPYLAEQAKVREKEKALFLSKINKKMIIPLEPQNNTQGQRRSIFAPTQVTVPPVMPPVTDSRSRLSSQVCK